VLKLPKDFVFAGFYLVSGIYSLGFSVVMTGITKPLSGRTAYIPVPDGLFPFEVATFAVFGAVFLAASFYHFRVGLRVFSGTETDIPSFVYSSRQDQS
jgi:hypothetical protein